MTVLKVFAAMCLAVYSAFAWFYKKLFSVFMDFDTKLKMILGIPFLIVALTPPFLISSPFLWVFHPDWGVYSEGIRVGMIHDWASDQQHFYDVFYTNEGQMFLGNQSVAWTNPDTHKEENPWKFSSSNYILEEYQPMSLGRQVVVHYKQVLWKWNSINGLTNYRVMSIEPVNAHLVDKLMTKDKDGKDVNGCGDIVSSAGGVINQRGSAPFAGRIVRVSTTGNVIDSWEALIQKGDSGGAFIPMSITDSSIKACADLFAASNVMSVIYYELSRVPNPLTRKTNYEIIGIEKVVQ
jgi:hypothetical protein